MRFFSPASKLGPNWKPFRLRRFNARRLPLRGGFPEGLVDLGYLANRRVRIALQGHAPFAAATLAVYETLKALRAGTAPKNLKGLASAELMDRLTRDVDVKARGDEFLGFKK